MTTKTMAEVLAEHQPEMGRRDLHKHCICGWTGKVMSYDFLPHQADALAAAGFGDVRDAGAKALEDAAAHLDQPGTLWWGDGGAKVQESQSGPLKFTKLTAWLRARAAAVRGEG